MSIRRITSSRSSIRCLLALTLALGAAATCASADAIAGDAFGLFAQAEPNRHAQRVNERLARQGWREQRSQQFEAQRAARAGQRDPASRGPEAPVAAPGPPPTPEPARDGGRPGRLTPEERRALRQQINDAGRDVYRGGGRP